MAGDRVFPLTGLAASHVHSALTFLSVREMTSWVKGSVPAPAGICSF